MQPNASFPRGLAVMLGGLMASAHGGALAPYQELATFHCADPNLTVELVAAEPDVVSPVCIAWDAEGRMWVAEMVDYPTARTGGRIRLLEDRDGDGRYERAGIFAEGFSFPTSVLPWRDGLLVAAAPDIWFVRDTDGDGRADERRVLFTGFGEGNQQLRVNGLTWGIDNWVYGANGRSDGEIRRPGDRSGREISIRRRDFRFRPDSGEFESLAGPSQFGTAFDDWGNRFLSWNTMPFRHVVIEARYLDRVPQLGGAETSQNLQPGGDDGRIFPLTSPPQVFNNESQTHFNASAGTSVYRGDALGAAYRGNVFVGEPLRNLVHRRVLVPEGATFSARRGEDEKEFLASTDPWFHPVNFATGPDGALQVVDFYRQFVEHPGYVPEEMRTKVDWRIGAQHGRIWRIRPKNWKPRNSRPALFRAGSSALVRHLDDSNGWWRITAQRLLVERRDLSVVPELERAARKSASPAGRLHALHTLDGLGALSLAALVTASRDLDSHVRAQAALLAERNIVPEKSTPAESGDFAILVSALRHLREDPEERVRLQAMLTLGTIETLVPASANEIEDRWMSLALLCSAATNPQRAWANVLSTHGAWFERPTRAQADYLEKVAMMIGGSDRSDDLRDARGWLVPGTSVSFPQFALFNGLAEGAKSNPRAGEVLTSTTRVGQQSIGIGDWIAAAAGEAATSTNRVIAVRLAAIRVLGNSSWRDAASVLSGLLAPGDDGAVQMAAARALGGLNDPRSAAGVVSRWADYSRSVRRQLLGPAANSSVLAAAVLDGVETGVVLVTEIDPATRQTWVRSPDPELSARTQRLFQRGYSSDREEVVRRFKSAAESVGDRAKGAALFARTCLQCHAMQGHGNAIGPSIYSVASQPKTVLLESILDPSRQLTPDYLSYTVTLTDGETLTGLVAAESAVSVTVRRPNAPDVTLARSRIRSVIAEGKSLMPDGLEQGWTTQDLADLLEFIRQPDDTLLPREN